MDQKQFTSDLFCGTIYRVILTKDIPLKWNRRPFTQPTREEGLRVNKMRLTKPPPADSQPRDRQTEREKERFDAIVTRR